MCCALIAFTERLRLALDSRCKGPMKAGDVSRPFLVVSYSVACVRIIARPSRYREEEPGDSATAINVARNGVRNSMESDGLGCGEVPVGRRGLSVGLRAVYVAARARKLAD